MAEAAELSRAVNDGDIFDAASARMITDAEKSRQAAPGATLDVFDQAAAMLPRTVKEPEPKGFIRKAYDFMGQNTGLGATGAALIGTALAPETGGLSLLIPALAAAAGGAAGAATEGKNPLTEGAKEGIMQGVFGGAGKVAQPAWQFLKNSAIKTFGGRAGVSEAAEGLFKKWFTPAEAAEAVYKKAAATGATVPLAAPGITPFMRRASSWTTTVTRKEIVTSSSISISSGNWSSSQVSRPMNTWWPTVIPTAR